MAEDAKSNRIGTAFMYMSGALLLMMLIREGKDLIWSRSGPQPYEPDDYQRRNTHRVKTRCLDHDNKHQRG